MDFILSPSRAWRLAILMAGSLVAGSLSGQPVYVTNAGPTVVYQVTGAGTKSTYATGVGVPQGLAFDSSGNLYVSNGDLLKVTPGGAVSTLAVGAGSQGVAVGADGNIYVANGNVIEQVTPAGVMTPFASGFAELYGLTFGQNGNLYAADGNGGTGLLYQITPAGVVSPFASSLGYALGLASDSAGNFYVSDITGGNIFKVDSSGTPSVFLTGLNHPRGVSFDSSSGLLFYTQGLSATTSLYEANAAAQQFFLTGGLTNGNYTAIKLAAVPEPAAFAGLLGVGALGLVLLRRRPAR